MFVSTLSVLRSFYYVLQLIINSFNSVTSTYVLHLQETYLIRKEKCILKFFNLNLIENEK